MLCEVGGDLVTDLERLAASERGAGDSAGEERSSGHAHAAEAAKQTALQLASGRTGQRRGSEPSYAGPPGPGDDNSARSTAGGLAEVNTVDGVELGDELELDGDGDECLGEHLGW